MKKPNFLDKLFGGGNKEERLGGEEAIARAVTHFTVNKDTRQGSDIALSEMPWIAALKANARAVKMPEIEAFVDDILALRVSHSRKGRSEMVDVIKHRISAIEEIKKQMERDEMLKSKLGGD